MFDINLLTLSEPNDQAQLPGLLAANTPRRTARGRAGDQIVLLLTQSGNLPLSSDELGKLLDRLVQTYFKTSGPVTAGLRSVAETLNQALLERNQRKSAAGSQTVGLLNMVVVHSDKLYLAHAGPTHSLLLAENAVEHYFEPQASIKGLGLSRNLVLRFYQAEIAPGDLVLLCPDPPVGWTPASLSGSSTLTKSALAERLLNPQPATLSLAIVQLTSGTGKISGPERLAPSLDALRMEAHAVEAPPAVDTVEKSATAAREDIPTVPPENRTDVVDIQPESGRSIRRSRANRPAPTPESPETPSTTPKDKPKSFSAKPTFGRLWRGARRIRQRTSSATRSFFSYLLPGQNGQPGSLSSGSMVFIAIAIPVVIVTLATMVYFQRGRAQQFQEYFSQAQNAAHQAANQTDPVTLRSAWETTLLYLDKAEAYQTTDESHTLRQQVQTSLDGLDGITRLSYQPAIVGGLATSVQVSRMIATASDLYLLDKTTSRVMRAILTGRGYEIDNTFRCEKGTFGSYKVGDILDITALPRGNEFKASILALDANGNLLYCIPGQAPLSAPLAPPDSNWGKITAFTYDSGTLYVLDPQVNSVWMYGGNNATFSERPQPFFDTNAPSMADVIDLTVNNTDLYLLHADGHLTLCTLSYTTTPTRCTDPATLTDPRPGHASNVPVIPGAQFTQIQFTQPPDPSLYFLDPNQAAIFHFSLRLNLQRVLRTQGSGAAELPQQPVSAYTIGPNRTAFLAFGNQIFYALVP
ncbi:MAG: hypothetical protein PHQ40_03440 [Anaerolineaceae bacterium]|nr:hypothetical protein [Anaerolineaceae bacterium]